MAMDNGGRETERSPNSFSSPIYSLSDDVIWKILCTLHNDGDFHRPTTPYSLVELTATQVCRSWRKLALSSPSLWSIFRNSQAPPQAVLDRLHIYIERSQLMPIDIWLDLGRLEEDWEEFEGAIKALLHAVLPRLRRLALISTDEYILVDLCRELAQTSAPSLEVLIVESHGENQDDFDFRSLPNRWDQGLFRGGSGSLKYFRLRAATLAARLPPLGSLVHLHLEEGYLTNVNITGRSVFDAIFSSATLETISIHGSLVHVSKAEYESGSQRTLVARALKHVRFHWPGYDDLEWWDRPEALAFLHFLRWVDAPELETLTLHSLIISQGISLPASRAEYHFPKLCTLTWIDVRIQRSLDVWGCLQTISSLTRTITELVVASGWAGSMKNYVCCGESWVGQHQVRWALVEKLTIDACVGDLNVLLRHLPSLKTLCFQGTSNEEAKPRLKIVGLASSDPMVPAQWPLGLDWMEMRNSVEDPFLKRRGMYP